MKYIRTKDKISGERIYENDIPEPKNNHEKEILQEMRDNIGEVIIKQADTIEELCDEFIVFGDIDRPYLTRHKFTNKEWNKQYFIGDRKLYGAIWTDKGLIYVAKMNDKGELELL